MAGLDLRGGAQVRVAAAATPPSTATEAAYGRDLTVPIGVKALLTPNDAAGLAVWWPLVSAALLVFLYYSLPA